MPREKLTGILAAFFASAVPLTAWTGTFEYSAYKPATIAEILAAHENTVCRKTDPNEFILSAYAFKYRIVTRFTRQLRELSPDVKELVIQWGKALPGAQKVAQTYQHELLVKDGANEYWVPVQEQLLPYMGDELKGGQKFELYIIVIGAVNNKCIFIATEFQALAN